MELSLGNNYYANNEQEVTGESHRNKYVLKSC